MSEDRDRGGELERVFHDVRAADRRRAPLFAKVLAGRSARRPHRRALWPALATSMALVAVFAVWRLTAAPETPFVIHPGEMRVPTDVLLDLVRLTPPRAGEIPRVGVVDWFPLEPAADQRRQQ